MIPIGCGINHPSTIPNKLCKTQQYQICIARCAADLFAKLLALNPRTFAANATHFLVFLDIGQSIWDFARRIAHIRSHFSDFLGRRFGLLSQRCDKRTNRDDKPIHPHTYSVWLRVDIRSDCL